MNALEVGLLPPEYYDKISSVSLDDLSTFPTFGLSPIADIDLLAYALAAPRLRVRALDKQK